MAFGFEFPEKPPNRSSFRGRDFKLFHYLRWSGSFAVGAFEVLPDSAFQIIVQR
jgi:hypothetical protein